MPSGLGVIAGPIMAAATAKANQKLGISNVFPQGYDYNWVCLCHWIATDNKASEKNHDRAANISNTKRKICPVDHEMGCYDAETQVWR